MQGVSVEFICITSFSLCILISNPSESNKYLGFAEMSLSLGRILGPIISLFLISYGYTISFLASLILDSICYYLLFFCVTTDKQKLNIMNSEELLNKSSDSNNTNNNAMHNNLNNTNNNIPLIRQIKAHFLMDKTENNNDNNNNNNKIENHKNYIKGNTISQKSSQNKYVYKRNYSYQNINSISKDYNNISDYNVYNNILKKNNMLSIISSGESDGYNTEISLDKDKDLLIIVKDNNNNNSKNNNSLNYFDNINNNIKDININDESKNKAKILNVKANNLILKTEHNNILDNNSQMKVKIKTKNQNQNQNQLDNNPLFFLKIIFNKLIFLSFLVAITDYIVQVFFMPVYTKVMHNSYNLSIGDSSFYLSIFYVLYFVGLRVMILLSDVYPPKFLMCMALVINSFGLVFFAPSSAFNINNIGSYFNQSNNISKQNNLYLSLFGYCFQNFFAGLVCLTCILDFTVSFKKLGFNEYVAGDVASAQYFLAVNISELIGPIIGGVFTSKYGYEITCDSIGIVNLLLSIVFMSYNFSRIFKRLLVKNNIEELDNSKQINIA